MNFLRRKSRILLIEPPFYRFFGYQRWHDPVTLTLIASYLQEQGHDVSIFDADQPTPDCRPLIRDEVRQNYGKYEEALATPDHPIWREVRNAIEAYAPEVIGLTSISPKIDAADKIALMAKEMFGDKVTTVLGGPHVQGMMKSHQNYSFGKHYDHVVHSIPDLTNRKPNKQLIQSHERYSPNNLTSIMTSFGCPNSCTFCCHSFDKTMVYRDQGNLTAELAEIHDRFGTAIPLYVMDDCFLSNTKHFETTSSLFARFGLKFSAGTRVRAITREKLDLFQQRGGQRLFLGIESGSQAILDRVNKRQKIAEVIERAEWLNAARIPWTAFLISGFPFETIDDMKMTVELLGKIRPAFISLNRFTPYPGTQLYDELYKDKPLRFSELYQLNKGSCVNLSDEMEDYIEFMYAHFDAYNQARKTELAA